VKNPVNNELKEVPASATDNTLLPLANLERAFTGAYSLEYRDPAEEATVLE
jgi:hypothetical protein